MLLVVAAVAIAVLFFAVGSKLASTADKTDRNAERAVANRAAIIRSCEILNDVIRKSVAAQADPNGQSAILIRAIYRSMTPEERAAYKRAVEEAGPTGGLDVNCEAAATPKPGTPAVKTTP